MISPAQTPPVLDACCGSKMFWFDRENPACVFMDKRQETVYADTCEGRRAIVVNPDIVADFTAIPFLDETFSMVVFDPPHLVRVGRKSWMCKKYGSLSKNWRDELRAGFAECWRVLKGGGDAHIQVERNRRARAGSLGLGAGASVDWQPLREDRKDPLDRVDERSAA